MNCDKSNAYRILVGKSEGKRTVGINRHKWEYNIKMDLRDILFSLRVGASGGLL
jgi:hypothetical protein